MMMAGGAASLACDEVLARGKLWASHLLEAAVADIDYSDGSFKVIGTDRSMALLELPWRINQASSIPQGLPSTLNNVSRFVSPAMTYPNGCHICEVEIDPETGELFILTYVAVDDVGRILSSDIVEGQILGGVAQGIGQVIGEKLIYDKDGSLLNGSFMDYRIPRADDLPKVDLVHLEVPCTTNPLGVKGAGESGVAGALPALASAVQDALRSAGVGDYVDIPFTAEKLWRALSPSRLAAR
jgi:carbon-monoxide dehydrogenase large subunit